MTKDPGIAGMLVHCAKGRACAAIDGGYVAAIMNIARTKMDEPRGMAKVIMITLFCVRGDGCAKGVKGDRSRRGEGGIVFGGKIGDGQVVPYTRNLAILTAGPGLGMDVAHFWPLDAYIEWRGFITRTLRGAYWGRL